MLTDHVHQQLSTDTDCHVSVMTADDIDNQSDCSAADPVSLSYIIHTYIHPLNGPLFGTTQVSRYQKGTRSSAIAEGPRDASCQLKSCQLPRNSAETTYTTSPDQIDGMKLEI